MKFSKVLLACISREVKAKKELLFLTDIQREILLGITLGDATIRLEGKLKIEQTIRQKEYVEHLYKIFKEYMNVPPAIRKITGGGAKDRELIWFQTFTHPNFKEYRYLFYKQLIDESGNLVFKIKETKNIPIYKKGISNIQSELVFITKWLTPRAIAYCLWMMVRLIEQNKELFLHFIYVFMDLQKIKQNYF